MSDHKKYCASIAGAYLARKARRKRSRDWKAEEWGATKERNWGGKGGKNWFSSYPERERWRDDWWGNQQLSYSMQFCRI